MNRFVIADPDKCIACQTCEIACVLAHPSGTESDPYTPSQFRPRLKLIKTKTFSTPVLCRHCENAPCVNACPTNALVYDRDTVQLVPERCIGCSTCVIACPYGVMEMAPVAIVRQTPGLPAFRSIVAQAHKCDLCIDRSTGPACMEACPTKALRLTEHESTRQEPAE